MIIVRTSPLTGKVNKMDLPITEQQLISFQFGAMVQDAFPDLSKSEREFILTGYTQEDWDKMFPPEADDPD